MVLCAALLWSTSAVAEDFWDMWREATRNQRLRAAQINAVGTWTMKNADFPLTAEGRKLIHSCVARNFSTIDRGVAHSCERGDEEKAFDHVLYSGLMCVQTNFVTGGFEDRRRK